MLFRSTLLGPIYVPLGYSQVLTLLSLIMSKDSTIQVNLVATLLNLSLETINKVLIICLGCYSLRYNLDHLFGVKWLWLGCPKNLACLDA